VVERRARHRQPQGRACEARKLFALPEAELAQLIRPTGYFNVKARRLRSFLRVLVEEYGADHDPAVDGRARLSQRAVPRDSGPGALGQTRPTPRLLRRFFAGKTSQVRGRLLAIHGIGPETADSLLLYAGGHHSFVIDAYTKRIFDRHEWRGQSSKSEIRNSKQASRQRKSDVHASGSCGSSYDELKALCESSLSQKPPSARLDYWQDYHAQLVMVGKHFCRTRAPRCDECPLRPLLPPAGSRR
jgi:endonuclease-3 related protein